MAEEVSYPVVLPGKNTSIMMWSDDTVETVRLRIGQAVGQHPDRLRIFVQTEIPASYYAADSRKWEDVFLRLSPDGKPISKPSLTLWESYTDPAWSLPEGEYDHAAWMDVERKRESSFTELRILGAPEERSWILPLDSTEPPFVPPASKVTISLQSLFQSVHPLPLKGFRVLPYEEGLRPAMESLYFPFLRSGSPAVVPDDLLRSIARQDELLRALADRSPAAPTRTTVVRARWKLPLVNTDFGSSIRNRFEQIFYGTTVSKNVPAISFFGGRQEQSRHKFFTSSNPKTPSLDLRTWQYWWTATKPSRNKPTLLFYRGSSRFVYDRITVTGTELIVSASRAEDSDERVETLQETLKEWILSIDGLASFLDPADLDETRWTLQDVSASLKYGKELKHADFRRFGCLRSIYEVVDHDKLLFKLLRADQTDLGLSPLEVRVVGLLRDNEYIAGPEVADELGISVEEADATISAVKEKLEDNPDLLDRQFSNLPAFRFSASTVVVTYAIDLKRIVGYINTLRDILLNPDDETLDEICPSRMETVDTAEAEVGPQLEPEEEEGGLDFLDELLGEIAGANAVAAPITTEAAPQKQQKKIAAKGSATTLANYLVSQLREFDSATYDPDDAQVFRKCDKPRQPVPLTSADVARLAGTPYDPKHGGPSKFMELKDPDGAIICPEYWCTYDRIPLSKDQLADGTCPVCGGKVRSSDSKIEKTQDIIEYPVIQRDAGTVYTGRVKYVSKKNGRQIPCCFTTAQTTKLVASKSETPSVAEAYYVLGETKAKLGSLRLGYIPKLIGKALGLPLQYADTIAAGNRIQAGQAGIYRAGVGRAAETLPTIVGYTGSVKRPLENVDATMRCSFFRTWKGVDVEDADEDIIPKQYTYRYRLAGRVASIDKAFREKRLTPLEELEYAALSLDCQLFVLYPTAESVELGCFLTMGAVRSVNRAVAVLIGEGGDPEYITHVARVTTTPQFNGNLYKTAFFPAGVLKTLNEYRGKACVSDIPTIDTALSLVQKFPSVRNRMPEMAVILDPYGRAQALFIPELILLPFKPTSYIPTFIETRITGYADVSTEELPYKGDMLDFLAEGGAGYAYAHDLGDPDGKVVELITRSGLRIPVQTDDEWVDNSEQIVQTVRDAGEDALVWGDPDPAIQKNARGITYEAEIFDFLLFQLAHDIHDGEDYRPLRLILGQTRPKVDELKPLLDEWVDSTLTFTEAADPPKFVRKMRAPCAPDSCDGSMCYQDGSSCRVEIKNVRPSLKKEVLTKRLLTTLLTNEKIRDIVWQNKTSPFFSSVLYLELPNELILSDAEVARKLRG
jgi:hypothetical protein